MRNKKRIFTMIISMMMILSLSACGTSNDASNTDEEYKGTVETTVDGNVTVTIPTSFYKNVTAANNGDIGYMSQSGMTIMLTEAPANINNADTYIETIEKSYEVTNMIREEITIDSKEVTHINYDATFEDVHMYLNQFIFFSNEKLYCLEVSVMKEDAKEIISEQVKEGIMEVANSLKIK